MFNLVYRVTKKRCPSRLKSDIPSEVNSEFSLQVPTQDRHLKFVPASKPRLYFLYRFDMWATFESCNSTICRLLNWSRRSKISLSGVITTTSMIKLDRSIKDIYRFHYLTYIPLIVSILVTSSIAEQSVVIEVVMSF